MAARPRLVVILVVLALVALGVATTLVLLELGRPTLLPALESARSGQPDFRADFDDRTADGLPAGFESTRTGPGRDGVWRVEVDATAPTPPSVLVQQSDDPTSDRFPMAVAPAVRLADLDVTVRFKPLTGQVDQAGGLVFRYRDPNHYYLVRTNALENNVRFYHVVNGQRSVIASGDATVSGGQWHILRVVCVGDRIDAYLGNTQVIGHRDTTITEAGAIGLWTKADSVTAFDHLEVWPIRR